MPLLSDSRPPASHPGFTLQGVRSSRAALRRLDVPVQHLGQVTGPSICVAISFHVYLSWAAERHKCCFRQNSIEDEVKSTPEPQYDVLCMGIPQALSRDTAYLYVPLLFFTLRKHKVPTV
ncbi:hypothetical protein CB1_000849073 [Camelus ferus]|nr:hypothetical protein CB1_000849073 [Camelus ferus]